MGFQNKLKLAVNLSNISLAIRNTHAIDMLKVHPLLWGKTLEKSIAVCNDYNIPILLHGLIAKSSLGDSDFTQIQPLQAIAQCCSLSNTPHCCVHFSGQNTDLETVEVIFKRTMDNYKWLSCALPMPIFIENAAWYPFRTISKVFADPEIFTDLLHRLNTLMVLDISHALVSAYHLGIDIHHYLARFPLSDVREIQFSGTAMLPGDGLRDTHGPPGSIELKLLRHAISICPNVQIVTLEYGDDTKHSVRNQAGESFMFQLNSKAQLMNLIGITRDIIDSFEVQEINAQ